MSIVLNELRTPVFSRAIDILCFLEITHSGGEGGIPAGVQTGRIPDIATQWQAGEPAKARSRGRRKAAPQGEEKKDGGIKPPLGACEAPMPPRTARGLKTRSPSHIPAKRAMASGPPTLPELRRAGESRWNRDAQLAWRENAKKMRAQHGER